MDIRVSISSRVWIVDVETEAHKVMGQQRATGHESQVSYVVPSIYEESFFASRRQNQDSMTMFCNFHEMFSCKHAIDGLGN